MFVVRHILKKRNNEKKEKEDYTGKKTKIRKGGSRKKKQRSFEAINGELGRKIKQFSLILAILNFGNGNSRMAISFNKEMLFFFNKEK